MGKKINVLIDGLDMNSFESMARTFVELRDISKEMATQMEVIEDRIKYMLKEKKWEDYKTPSNIHLKRFTVKKERINKNLLSMLLPQEKLQKVLTTTHVETLSILSPKDRVRLKKYVN